MKIYTKLVLDMTNWEVVEEESFDYDGPMDLCVSFGGGGESSSSKPVRLPLWSPGQRKLWKEDLYPYLKEGMEGPATSYPRQLFVPRTEEEEAYFGMSSGYSPDIATQMAKDLATRKAAMADSLNDPAFSINKEATDAFFQKSIKAPMMQEYNEIVDPGIREAFAGPGYWGSERARAQMQGAEHLATTLGSQYGQLQYADEQARENRWNLQRHVKHTSPTQTFSQR